MYTLIKWTNQGTTSLTRTAISFNCTARSFIPSLGNSQFITSTSLGETNKQTKLYIHVHVLLIYTWKTEDTFQLRIQIFFKKGEAGGWRDKAGGKVKIWELFHVYSRYKGIFTHTKNRRNICYKLFFWSPSPFFCFCFVS